MRLVSSVPLPAENRRSQDKPPGLEYSLCCIDGTVTMTEEDNWVVSAGEFVWLLASHTYTQVLKYAR